MAALDFVSFWPGLLALIIALFVPGYFLCLGFFPARKDLSRLERIVFSFVFSLVFLPLLVLFENLLLRLPIEFLTVSGSAVFLVLLGLVLYLLRSERIPLPPKLAQSLKAVKKDEALPLLPLKQKN